MRAVVGSLLSRQLSALELEVEVAGRVDENA